MLILRKLSDYITYWEHQGQDGEGGESYAKPRVFKARWMAKPSAVDGNRGTTQVDRGAIVVGNEVEPVTGVVKDPRTIKRAYSGDAPIIKPGSYVAKGNLVRRLPVKGFTVQTADDPFNLPEGYKAYRVVQSMITPDIRNALQYRKIYI